jgi:hypothetical protein
MLRATAIYENPIWMACDPAFSTPNLISGLLDRTSEPPRPIDVEPSRVGKLAIFVGEDNYVAPKDCKEVADFLPVTIPCNSLITVDARITPK